ncbi:MAG TPA: response regulator transcription factor [Sphingomicrobium sp.]|nr:response regulator transcription factor [Sphingomicrobium sp.]
MSVDGREFCDAALVQNGNSPRIVVASGILLYREGLAASLARDSRLEVVAVTDLSETLAAVTFTRPDAVVLDAATAEGLALARRLKNADPTLPLVGFGISESAADVIGCAEAGVIGFVDQNGSIDALVRVVSDALRGEFTCSPRVATILCARLARLADRGSEASPSLTPREHEIAGMVAEGMSNKEIAQGLRIGPTTVKNHVHNILDKLQVRRRAAIASRVAASEFSSLQAGRNG